MPGFIQFFRGSKTALSQRLIEEGTEDSHAHPDVLTQALQPSRTRLRAKRMGTVLGKFFCCGGQTNRPKREHTRRRHRRKHGAAASRAPTFRNDQLVAPSVTSGSHQQISAEWLAASSDRVQAHAYAIAETEYHDAREVFSVGDAGERATMTPAMPELTACMQAAPAVSGLCHDVPVIWCLKLFRHASAAHWWQEVSFCTLACRLTPWLRPSLSKGWQL